MSPEDDRTVISSSTPMVVLYADIAGSTRLYEKYGDAVAQEAISACLNLLAEVVELYDGRIIKTIGDEIQCVLSDPEKAIHAGTDMQAVIQEAGEKDRFATGPLRIKVALHYGPIIEVDGEVTGQAELIAKDIIQLAKADQVLVSAPTLDAVPGALRMSARYFDEVQFEGLSGEVEVYELLWEDSGVTHVSDYRPTAEDPGYTRLLVSYDDQEFQVGEAYPTLTIGRVKGNDVVVPMDLTSRKHAKIHFSKGRFRITDVSVNGTLVIRDDGRSTTLRREHSTLEGSGLICVGGTPEGNPGGVLKYRCI